MTFSRAKPGGWAVNEKLTSPQINAMDVDHEKSLDKSIAGDSLEGVVTMTGAGRIRSAVSTTNINTALSVVVGNGNNVIRLTSDITANRTYTLSASGAGTNDVITIYADASMSASYTVTVNDQAAATLFTLGNNDTADGQWASFIYIGGWRLYQQSQGARWRRQAFTAPGSWVCPRGVTQVFLTGCGGGGEGGGGRNGTTTPSESPRGGGGGAGALLGTAVVAVTPGTTYTVTIGAGGSGAGLGGTSPSAGADGADTTFDSLATFKGGKGGRAYASLANDAIVARGGQHANLSYSDIDNDLRGTPGPSEGGMGGSCEVAIAFPGGNSAQYSGGAGGANGSFTGEGGGGGGGGAGPFGAGGAGGAGGIGGGGSGIGDDGGFGGTADDNTGAGGGGGGGGESANPTSGGLGRNGGNGGSGYLIVSWVK